MTEHTQVPRPDTLSEPAAPRLADDRKLCEQLLRGDEHAYHCFFVEYFPKVLRFCANKLPSEDVEDVAMSVMTRVFRKLETWRGEASLYTWICQVARSEVANHFRTRGRTISTIATDSTEALHAEVDAVTDVPETEPDQALELQQSNALLAQALDELPAAYGNLLEAKYIVGLSMKEIAEQQQMTPKGVESALSRARKALKEKLDALNKAATTTVVSLSGERV